MYALLGFLFGLFTKVVYDWNKDVRERQTIRQSLLLEILHMHEPQLRLLLDKYVEQYKNKQFQSEDLGAEFWRPEFSTRIYESHISSMDRLIGSDLCLQLHYYYSLVKGLNQRNTEAHDRVDEDFAKSYLASVAHTYAMGVGAVEAILGNAEARKAMRDNLRARLESFDDARERTYVADILSGYQQGGAASHLKRPPPRRLTGLLRRHWF